MRPKFYLDELNQKFSVSIFKNCPVDLQRSLRLELITEVRKLRKQFIVLPMTPDQALVTGLKQENRTAIAISVLVEKLKQAGYEYLVFRDTIRVLRTHLINELFGGKNIFYEIDEDVIGIDMELMQFILDKKLKCFTIEKYHY